MWEEIRLTDSRVMLSERTERYSYIRRLELQNSVWHVKQVLQRILSASTCPCISSTSPLQVHMVRGYGCWYSRYRLDIKDWPRLLEGFSELSKKNHFMPISGDMLGHIKNFAKISFFKDKKFRSVDGLPARSTKPKKQAGSKRSPAFGHWFRKSSLRTRLQKNYGIKTRMNLDTEHVRMPNIASQEVSLKPCEFENITV